MVATLELLCEITVPPRRIPSGTLVTARSYFIDRIAPDCEIVALPEGEVAGGALTLSAGPLQTGPARRRGFGKLVRRARERAPGGAVLIDLRHHDPDNWAHFLNNHLPLVFWAAETADCDWGALLLLLPADIPGYILKAAALFGLEVRATDAVVEGEGLTVAPAPWTAVRPVRAGWVGAPKVQAALSAALAAQPGGALPKKVFLSRRKTRTLANEAEIETVLAARGFRTIYAEDLPAADQMRLFREAEEVVAVHGAALAPLLYCPPGARPRRLIELLAPGHMTNVYRAMAAELGVAWIGVRGRLKPEYVNGAYDFDTPYRAHSLDNFELDPVSLERAFEMSKGAG